MKPLVYCRLFFLTALLLCFFYVSNAKQLKSNEKHKQGTIYFKDDDGDFVKGFIITRTTRDTIYGFIRNKISVFQRIDFKLKPKDSKYPLRADSIIAFGYDNTFFKYYQQTGWSKRLLSGKIDLYEGEIFKLNKIEKCFVLKKDQIKATYVSHGDVKLVSNKLREKTKMGILPYINDNVDCINHYNK